MFILRVLFVKSKFSQVINVIKFPSKFAIFVPATFGGHFVRPLTLIVVTVIELQFFPSISRLT